MMCPNSMAMFGYRPTQVPFKRWKIVRGDTVEILSGKDKGKRGVVQKVMRKENKILVEGVHVQIKHVRASMDENREGTKYQKLGSIHVSNVSLIDPESDKPSKVFFAYLEDGQKVRIAKKSGALIAKPDRSEDTYEKRHRDKVDGDKDTNASLVFNVTYQGEDLVEVAEEFKEFIKEKEAKEKLLVFPEEVDYSKWD